MIRTSRFILALLFILAGATSRAADGVPAPAESEPIIRGEPLTVAGKRLTGSPATVSRVELAATPQFQLSTVELSTRAANFFVADNGARSFTDIFALRGLTNTPIFGDPAVSVYLDGIPLGSGFTFPADLTGFAAAELHRGPGQNTVFGRSGSAGVLTLSTPPAESSAAGEVRVGAGNFDARSAAFQAASSGDGAMDAYASVGWAARDGYIINTTLGHDIDDKDALSALTRLRYRPGDTAELTLLVTAFRARDGVQPLVPLGGPLYTVQRSAEGVTEVDAFNAGLTAAFDTPFGKLTATTAFTDWQLGPYRNTLNFGFAELSNDVTQQQRNWSEEIRLASAAADNVRWQLGAFFGDGQTEGTFRRAFGPMVYENSAYETDNRSLAAFGEATFDVGPLLSLTAGLRAEDSRKELARQEFVPAPSMFTRTAESTALLPKVALRYAVAAETTAFASLGAGYKPGGFSAFTGNAALAAFGPERTRAFEAGVTQASSDRAFSATTRVFWYEITGYQIERSFSTGGPVDDYLVVNAPSARSLGGEVELAWRPFPGLTVAADVGASEATLREFRDPYSGAVYDGRRAPAVPALDLSVRARFEHPTGWFVGGELETVGRTYYTEAEDLMFGQRSYSLLGAELGYATSRWRVTVFGANLTAEDYYSAITPGTGHATPGAPRTYGIEASARW